MKNTLESFLNKSEYQVFLMESPCNFPFFFFKHHWLAVNNRGTLTRWETGYSRTLGAKRWGFLRINAFPYYEGIPIISFYHKWRWPGKITKMFSGSKGSLAHRMVQTIESSPRCYPFKYIYSWFGPNSNTYPQWVLDQFPEAEYRLPRISIGSNFK